MAFQTMWFYTDIPGEIIDCLEKDLANKFDSNLEESKLQGDNLDNTRRSSTNAWISSDHWVSGFVWHYVTKANRDNFRYDLTGIDSETLQYTRYEEGDFYNWHIDAGIGCSYKPRAVSNNDNQGQVDDFVTINCEYIRKLSFIVQLSDPEDYEGGNVQFLDENKKTFFAPRKKGSIILFDSRTQHRVLKVTKGVRKSIVGWTVGPRWR